jgi:hypothetical protein
MRLEISPPPDAQSVTVWAHAECISRLREPTVQPDNPLRLLRAGVADHRQPCVLLRRG